MAQSIPNRQTKKWRVSYKGDFFGDVIKGFLISLYQTSGIIRPGGKLYPHSVTSILPPSDFTPAKISNGSADTNKLWAVTPGKKIWRSIADAAFALDAGTGFGSTEDTNDGSDILSVPDPSGNPIDVVELSTPVGAGAFSVTGAGNTVKWAQSFTRVSGPFTKLDFYAAKVGLPTDSITISFQADAAGVPSGTPLSSFTLDANALTTSYQFIEEKVADFTASLQFDASKIYHLVFERTGAADASNYVVFIIAIGGINDPSLTQNQRDLVDNYKGGELLSYNGSTWVPTITYIQTDTFMNNGTWTVPAGVVAATVEGTGAGGGAVRNTGGGGGGAYSKSLLTGLTPGDIYDIGIGPGYAHHDGANAAFGLIRALVVAGGGGAGKGGSGTYAGGGGGGGGFYDQWLQVAATAYAVTVGAGGAGSSVAGSAGANGSDSSLGALLVAKGGGGSSGSAAGLNGGSGGGGGGGGAGTDNLGGNGSHGFNGGKGKGNASVNDRAAGGGGGAGGDGGDASTDNGGDGGVGRSSDISGSTVFYGGGGGGGALTHKGVGGNGGGGTAASTGADGTANTGGGGGGSDSSHTGGSGGSGVVIIKYRTGVITATGGTITTSGGWTTHTFTSNGTFTVSAVTNTKTMLAIGGQGGANGSLGGLAANGLGTTKYSGSNGVVAAGDASFGGQGAGDIASGDNGGNYNGGGGGGTLNTTTVLNGLLFGGGGMSQTTVQGSGATGVVKVSYIISTPANYPIVCERLYGHGGGGSTASVVVPPTVLPGERLLVVISAHTSAAMSALAGWDSVGQKSTLFGEVTQGVFTKVATGDDSGSFSLGASTGWSYVLYRMHNAGVPTMTQATGSGTIDPPQHNTGISKKYLWIAAGSAMTDSSSINGPSAPPTNYTSMIVEEARYQFDTLNALGAKTMVSERRLQAASEDPGAYTDTYSSNSVAGTIAVPYEANSYFRDLSFALSVEFPQANERLYLTTDRDVKFLNVDDGIWQSLWEGVFQQDPLDTNYPHPMKQISAGQVLFVGDRNKIHSMIATGNNAIEALAGRITVPKNYYNSWIAVTKSSVFFGFNHVDSEILEGLVVYFEPSSELSRMFRIKEGATVGFVVDENCHIIDKSGQIRYFNGSSFTAYAYLPPYFNKEKITTLPHRNAFSAKDGLLKFLWAGQYPYPAGQWVYEDNNLYHEKGLVFSSTLLNSYGTIDAGGTFRALFDDGNAIFAGATVDNGAGGTVAGIFSTFKLAGTTVSDSIRSFIQTARFTSEEIDTKWGRVFAKIDTYLSGLTSGSIVLKHRSKKGTLPEGSGAASYAGTWTNSTHFTCSDAGFVTAITNGDIKVGDEVIIRKGMGAGFLTHIAAITGTSTKTITVTEGMAAITTGSFNFSVENWSVMGQKMVAKDTSAEWLQLKVELRDQVGLEELQITSAINKNLNK